MNHVCANDKQNLMNIGLIELTAVVYCHFEFTQSMLIEGYKAQYRFLEQNFVVKVCLGKKQGLYGSNFKLYAIKSVLVRRSPVWRWTFVYETVVYNKFCIVLRTKPNLAKPCRLGELHSIYNGYCVIMFMLPLLNVNGFEFMYLISGTS